MLCCAPSISETPLRCSLFGSAGEGGGRAEERSRYALEARGSPATPRCHVLPPSVHQGPGRGVHRDSRFRQEQQDAQLRAEEWRKNDATVGAFINRIIQAAPLMAESRMVAVEVVDVLEPELLCNAIHKLFLYGNKHKESERQLFLQTNELVDYFRSRPSTPDDIECVADLERKIVSAKGANKQFIEESLFECLELAVSRWDSDEEVMQPRSLEATPGNGSEEQRTRRSAAAILVGLCREILPLSVARDRFNSKRKALALELLAAIGRFFEVPGALKIAREAIENKKDVVAEGGIEFYKNYLRIKNTRPTKEMLDLLDRVVAKTRSRSLAVAALDLQVKAGVIHELEALSLLDDWKAKRRGRNAW